MRLKLKQWKGRFALFLALCMIMLLTGCGREVSGAGTSGAQMPETRETAVEASGAGTSGAQTPETRATAVEASGAGTSGAETPETKVAAVEASGAGTSGMETPETRATVEAAKAGTSNAETPETKAAAKEVSQVETSSAETPETKIVGDSAQGDEPNDLRTEQKASIDEEGSYTTADDVSLYLHTYEKLPNNFITKQEARQLGWQGGSLEPYAPGKCIGGDKFGNYEGLLPEKKGRTYRECDIDTLGADSRGAKRIIYSDDGLIYYTEDHYASFTLLYD